VITDHAPVGTRQRPRRTGPVAQATRASGGPANHGRAVKELGAFGAAVGAFRSGNGTSVTAPARLPIDGVQATGGGPDLSAGYFNCREYGIVEYPIDRREGDRRTAARPTIGRAPGEPTACCARSGVRACLAERPQSSRETPDPGPEP